MVSRSQPSNAFLGLDEGDVFLKLSALLTGVGDLDPRLGEDYRRQLEPKYGPAIEMLCELYYEVVREPNAVEALKARIAGNEQLAAAARQIVTIWYLSQFRDPDPNVKTPLYAGHFERGLLWRVIDAHPAAFSARRHGYWALPPQEL
jgi:hypothetical protein